MYDEKKLNPPMELNMANTWTERADKVLAFLDKFPVAQEGSFENDFKREVFRLCQQLKDADHSGGQFIPQSLMD